MHFHNRIADKISEKRQVTGQDEAELLSPTINPFVHPRKPHEAKRQYVPETTTIAETNIQAALVNTNLDASARR